MARSTRYFQVPLYLGFGVKGLGVSLIFNVWFRGQGSSNGFLVKGFLKFKEFLGRVALKGVGLNGPLLLSLLGAGSDSRSVGLLLCKNTNSHVSGKISRKYSQPPPSEVQPCRGKFKVPNSRANAAVKVPVPIGP